MAGLSCPRLQFRVHRDEFASVLDGRRHDELISRVLVKRLVRQADGIHQSDPDIGISAKPRFRTPERRPLMRGREGKLACGFLRFTSSSQNVAAETAATPPAMAPSMSSWAFGESLLVSPVAAHTRMCVSKRIMLFAQTGG